MNALWPREPKKVHDISCTRAVDDEKLIFPLLLVARTLLTSSNALVTSSDVFVTRGLLFRGFAL